MLVDYHQQREGFQMWSSHGRGRQAESDIVESPTAQYRLTSTPERELLTAAGGSEGCHRLLTASNSFVRSSRLAPIKNQSHHNRRTIQDPAHFSRPAHKCARAC
ncbi:hypothetical protein M419DRAFT_122524 [Trichoderma reesei RUT C-30]|uniref:Uncharacterized protein n=1 Tax=Hypocrea jecorina (strain ATCC 56765 / BCRC 32924 / NRRL 11460 / Rut C-30) TaxID=1344414 RepID=A0A024SES1_HYPJR|nr:hypothetical protein M419DRAFT_122524 [Trichoderma reesei RUT C-30]